MLGYHERPVQPALARRVVCTWVDLSRDKRHPVLPDACIDLVWDGATVTVAGPDTQAWPVTGRATFFGIRFLPGSAPGFLGVPASELRDQTVPLSEFWGSVADDLAERLAAAGSAAADVLEDVVLQRQACAWPVDELVEQIVRDLGRGQVGRDLGGEEAGGAAVVQRLADHLGVSERSLHRRCTDALGYGPKTLDRILRFRRALRLVSSGVALADVAWRAGYADQAHMTNECRRLAGTTPGELTRGSSVTISANGS